MIVLFLLLVLFSGLLSLPAWNRCRAKNEFFWWDYGMPVYPLLMWVFFVYVGIGPQSLSNTIELLFISVVVIALSYLRAFVFNKFLSNVYFISMFSIVLSIFVVLILRLTMPLIPE
jgi:lipopolysaccharide export LptBFGC system permease protein LptF